jgi:hypothetical protein
MKNLIKILLKLFVVGALISGVAFGARIKPKAPKEAPKIIESPEKTVSQKAFSFAAPKGWQCIDDKTQLPAKVEIVYIGTGKGGFTPSLNLATETTTLSIDEYVNLAKNYHESNGQTKCHNLGSLETKAGGAHLLQIDRTTQWGPVRFLQASLINKGVAYVLTATCLEKEFATHYPHFLNAIQTLEIYAEHK